MTFPQISDDAGVVYERFDIPYQPAIVVVDAAGEVETIFGAADEAVLDGILTDISTSS